MDFIKEYEKKFTTYQAALNHIRSGDTIYCMNSSAEPVTFLGHLHELQGKVRDLTLYVNQIVSNPKIFEPQYSDLLPNIGSSFYSRQYEKLHRAGRSTYTPLHLGRMALDPLYHYELTGQRINVVVLAVSPMDKHGYFTSGSFAGYVRDMVEFADFVILEVNEACPRTFGDTYIHISEADMIYRAERDELLRFPTKDAPDETDRIIGKYIADIIDDGSTLQLGIGGIPSACIQELKHKKDLGIHTEMLNDGLVYLLKCGAVTNSKKNFFKNKSITSFTAGTLETYNYINDNPSILHLNVKYVNHPSILARNDNMISVNSSLQVDLMGQCSSEAFQTVQIAGTGGQNETVLGAKQSKGGKSIIALHSTVMAKNEKGERERKSTIQPIHPEGTVVTLTRNDVDHVATEYGIAALRGATLKERARALINIAHPDYRDWLEEEAKRYYLL